MSALRIAGAMWEGGGACGLALCGRLLCLEVGWGVGTGVYINLLFFPRRSQYLSGLHIHEYQRRSIVPRITSAAPFIQLPGNAL